MAAPGGRTDEEVPDFDEINQGNKGARDRRRRFAKGRSGNAAGRPAQLFEPGRHGLPGCCSMASHGIDAQRRLAGACRRLGRHCGSVSTVPLRRVVLRAIDASDFENRLRELEEHQAVSRENTAALRHNWVAPRPLSETNGGAFYLDCRVGRKAATSPGLRNILSTSLA
jgi:hypothetical protein